MKKILAFILCLALTVGISTSCGKSKETVDVNAPISLTVDKNISAKISILVPSGNQNETDMIQCLIEDFKDMYPNVTIEMNYISVTNYESSIRNLAGAGTLDDIIWSNSPDFYYLVGKNLVKNLTPYIEASEAANVFDFENDFYTEFFECGELDDKLYCVPRSADSVVTFINTKIFNDAHVDMTKVKNGWTWQDFIDTCETIRNYFDNNGMSDRYVVDANLTNWLSVCYPMLSAYGAEVVDANGDIKVNSAQMKECLEMVRYMVDHKYICSSSASSGSSYESGTSAMLFQSASVSLFADRKALKGNVDLVSFPLITDNNTPKIGCGIAGYCIKRDTKYADLCWQFLNHLLSYDGQQNMANNGLNLASIRKDLADYTTANWGKKYSTINLSAYLYGSDYKIDSKFLVNVPTTYRTDVSTAIKDMFGNATNPKKTIDECLSTAVKDLEDAMEL